MFPISFFFFNDTATTEIYTLSLHDALPILKKMQDRNLDALSAFQGRKVDGMNLSQRVWRYVRQYREQMESALDVGLGEGREDRKSTRLNSSHANISYAVFCLKKKKKTTLMY